VARTVSRLARAVTAPPRVPRDNAGMTNPDFTLDRARLAHLVATASHAEVDARLAALHVTYHARPLDHVRVHVEWLRVLVARRAYARAVFHAFAGFVVAAPASLVQRYTGLVVPAFAERR
jgi:hypothetical protein